MKCKKPTWNNIKYFYRNVHIVVVKQNEKIIESTIKGMTENHLLIARLLDVPTKKYLQLRDWWWEFS